MLNLLIGLGIYMDDSQVDTMLDYIRRNWTDSVLPSLCDFIRIPAQSPSFDPDWEARGELDQAIELFCSWLDTLGIEDMTYETHRLPGRTPILLRRCTRHWFRRCIILQPLGQTTSGN